MGNLAPVEQLNSQITRRLHDAKLTVDRPANADGHWWIDVEHQGHLVSVEFRPGEGFGVCGSNGGYGEGPDVVVANPAAAADQVVVFLVASRLRGDLPSTRDLMRGFEEVVTRVVEELLGQRLETTERELAKRLASFSRDVKKLEAEVSELTDALRAPAARQSTKSAPKTPARRKSKQRAEAKTVRSGTRR